MTDFVAVRDQHWAGAVSPHGRSQFCEIHTVGRRVHRAVNELLLPPLLVATSEQLISLFLV